MKIFFALYSLACLLLGFFTSERFDYKYFYSGMWSRTLNGQDPWLGNSLLIYPPAFNLFAAPYFLHPLLPKLIFILAGLWVFYFLIKRNNHTDPKRFYFSNVLMFLNPFFIIFGCIFGCADILVAALCIAAIDSAEKDKKFLSSLTLAFATLFKMYPALIAPVLLLSFKGKNRIQWAANYIGLLLMFTLIGWLVWGNNSFLPFARVPFSEPNLMSLPAFLHGFFPFSQLFYAAIFLTTWIAALGLCFVYEVELSLSSLIIFSLSLATFKKGNIQLLSIVVFLLLYQLLDAKKPEKKFQFYISAAFYLWIQFVAVWYYSPDILPIDGYVVRQLIGLPHFIIVAAFVFYSLKTKPPKIKI